MTTIRAIFMCTPLLVLSGPGVVVPAVYPGSFRIERHVLIPAIYSDLRNYLITINLASSAEHVHPITCGPLDMGTVGYRKLASVTSGHDCLGSSLPARPPPCSSSKKPSSATNPPPSWPGGCSPSCFGRGGMRGCGSGKHEGADAG